MTLLKALFLVILGLLIFWFGLQFTIDNKDLTALHLGHFQLPGFPLGLWILIAFTSGGILGMFINMLFTIRLKARNIKVQRDLKRCQQELSHCKEASSKDSS